MNMIFAQLKLPSPPVVPSRQRGATLIVVLVVLIAMTFLGLGAMSDTNLQLAMVRNSQMQTSAYNAALSEINAQLEEVNSNPETEVDQLILDLVQVNPDANGFRSITPDKKLLAITESADEDDMPYVTDLTLVEPDSTVNLLVENYSISPGSSVKWMVMELRSEARVKGTESKSSQVQGFRYLSAN